MQFVDAGIRVLDALSTLCRRIRGHPEKLSERQRNIMQVVEITKIINTAPALHTDIIRAILDASTFDARQLFDLLEPLVVKEDDTKTTRCWKTICGLKQESRILDVLDRLEERRTALILCIGIANSKLISDVDQSIVDLTFCSRDSFRQIPCIQEAIERIATQVDVLVTSGNITQNRQNETPETTMTLRAVELALPRLDDRLEEILKLQKSIYQLAVRFERGYGDIYVV